MFKLLEDIDKILSWSTIIKQEFLLPKRKQEEPSQCKNGKGDAAY